MIKKKIVKKLHQQLVNMCKHRQVQFYNIMKSEAAISYTHRIDNIMSTFFFFLEKCAVAR